MMFVFEFILILLGMTIVFSYPAGLVSVEKRDIKNHQFRMLTGTIALGLLLLIYVGVFITSFFEYSGLYRGAYNLLFWLIVGLGLSGFSLSLLAVWSMYEAAWDLHRRAGMFGMLSGTFSGLSSIIASLMRIF